MIEAAESGPNYSVLMDIFCSAQSASESCGSECLRQEGTQTKTAFISPAKINSAYVLLCVLDVFVFIRLYLSSQAGQITWLHMFN